MAQEYALKMLENLNPMQMDKPTRDGIAYECFELAEAMLAEADKRVVKLPDVFFDTKPNGEWYPKYEVGRNYSPDDYVMYNGEKTLAVSINEEWQPDWSQAPDGFDWWALDECGDAYFYSYEPYVKGGFDSWADADYIHADGAATKSVSLFGYSGNWKDSLRKRP